MVKLGAKHPKDLDTKVLSRQAKNRIQYTGIRICIS